MITGWQEIDDVGIYIVHAIGAAIILAVLVYVTGPPDTLGCAALSRR